MCVSCASFVLTEVFPSEGGWSVCSLLLLLSLEVLGSLLEYWALFWSVGLSFGVLGSLLEYRPLFWSSLF